MKNRRFFGYENMSRNKDNWAFVKENSLETTIVLLYSHFFTKALNETIGNLANILMQSLMKTQMKTTMKILMH